MIRVLNITGTPYSTGGVETLLLEMAKEHDTRTFEVSYCNLFFPHSTFAEELRRAGGNVTSIGSDRMAALPLLIAQLARFLRSTRPDIVHTHMLHASIAGQAAALLAGMPVRIVTRHYFDAQVGRTMAAFDRCLTRNATRAIAVSRSIGDEMLAGGVDRSRLAVVHNGVSLDRIDAAATLDQDGTPWPRQWEDGLLIGNVANLFHYKGHDTLIRAIAAVARQNPSVRLVIIGEGRERPALEALVRELALDDRVLLAGRRSDVAALLRRCHIYAHPARMEPFGIAVLEAMAARLPVVASTAGGLSEIVVPDETGLLVPPADENALASALLELAADRERAIRMGIRGRERVEARFSIRAATRATEAVYLDALAAVRGSSRAE